MCKIAIVVASLLCASHGRPLQPPAKASDTARSSQNDGKSLAMLLLTHKSEAGFSSGATPGQSIASNARRSGDVRAQSLGARAYDAVSGVGRILSDSPESDESAKRVGSAIRKIERDAAMLEVSATSKPQLAPVEIAVLTSLVGVSFGAPYTLPGKVVEVLVPLMGALAAAVGFSAEYNGKVAVARGKEIASISLQAAAEAESYLAQAERAKSIIPLTVAFSASFAATALVVPELLEVLEHKGLFQALSTEILMVCPIICVLAAAVGALANQETQVLAGRAVNLGARRFSSAREVGRTWLSASQQVTRDVRSGKAKWQDFVVSILPAPLIGAIFPGSIGTKAVVISALAAVQCAYSLAFAEFVLSEATESVATKTRSAAVSDTYANQGMRSGAILPFTSALSAFCAAATVAVVEFLPYAGGPVGESLVCALFPALGSTVGAAASIAKARAEVDAEAATAAATLLSETREAQAEGPIMNTLGLMKFTVRNMRKTLNRGVPGLFFGLLGTMGRILTLGLFFRPSKKAVKY
mmetsp:Transcript_27168/g.47134  ORF Transcript_27168/g.47134 Transcript_27168/m.47134 type:complete len:528 (+) Transcript_27168:78-1661(+)